MIFKNNKDKDVEVTHGNFKQILRGGILGSALIHVEFRNGTVEWIKATEEEILKAVQSK